MIGGDYGGGDRGFGGGDYGGGFERGFGGDYGGGFGGDFGGRGDYFGSENMIMPGGYGGYGFPMRSPYGYSSPWGYPGGGRFGRFGGYGGWNS